MRVIIVYFLDPPCDSGYYQNGLECYWVSRNAVAYSSSQTECSSSDGEIVKVSKETDKFLVDVLQRYVKEDFWLEEGGNNIGRYSNVSRKKSFVGKWQF